MGSRLKLIIILLFLSTFSTLLTQTVIIPDTSAQRGIIHKIPVYLEYEGNTDRLTLKIEFNAYLLDVKSVKAGAGYLINEDNVSFTQDISDLENSYITINSFDISGSSGKLCEIEYEALAGPDSVAYFFPTELSINNVDIDAVFNDGRISIGDPVFPITKNTISDAYPNPVMNSTGFDIVINDPGTIEIKIFAMSGRIVAEYPSNSRNDFEFLLMNTSTGVPLILDEGEILEEGKYRLRFNPFPWNWSAQVYVVVARLGNEVYQSKFMIIK